MGNGLLLLPTFTLVLTLMALLVKLIDYPRLPAPAATDCIE
jgi:hypothetical protein